MFLLTCSYLLTDLLLPTHLWLSSGSSPVSLQLSRPDSPAGWSVVCGGASLEYSPPGVRVRVRVRVRVGVRVGMRVRVRVRARVRAIGLGL